MIRLVLASCVTIWVAYFIGRGHEYREWLRACDAADDIAYDLPPDDPYTTRLMRALEREEIW